MLDRGQIDVCTFEILRSTANILDGHEVSYPAALACFERAEVAVRTSKLMILRSDMLIEQLNRDLVRFAVCDCVPPGACAACACEDCEARRAERIL